MFDKDINFVIRYYRDTERKCHIIYIYIRMIKGMPSAIINIFEPIKETTIN